MSQRGRIGISWSPEREAAWRRIASEMHKKPSVLARDVLEEFLSCFLEREELRALGMPELEGRDLPLFTIALDAQARRKGGRKR